MDDIFCCSFEDNSVCSDSLWLEFDGREIRIVVDLGFDKVLLVVINSFPLDLSGEHLLEFHIGSDRHFLDVHLSVIDWGLNVGILPHSIKKTLKINGLASRILIVKIGNVFQSEDEVVFGLWDDYKFDEISNASFLVGITHGAF